ncbi:hypothetical protein ACXZ1K_13855 [Pedobacter sp. PWIIR3]
MKKIFTIILITLLSAKVYSQGCVAIRSTGGICSLTGHPDSASMEGGSWVFNANTRYFMSNKHYKGDVYQKERIKNGNEVINHQFATDLTLIRVFNDRWSAMVDVPVISNARSSKYEHNAPPNLSDKRGSTHSFGLGDIRIAAYRWLFNPATSPGANLQVGLGIKFATGDYEYKDYWQNVGPGGAPELRTVDQSIQLGDGGTGLTLELNGFVAVARHFGLYGNAFYLSNPRQNNGVRTYRELVSASLANEAISSVPDQFMARLGANYAVDKFVFSAGARMEGIPVYDVIGGSGDFRRPGYVVSVEPSLTYQLGKVNLYASVPTAVYRKRTQSVTDKQNSVTRATFVNGDAAFADYSVNIGVSFRL